MEVEMERCVICSSYILDHVKDWISVGSKAADTINNASNLQGLDISVVAGQRLHITCRRNFTNTKRLNKIKDDNLNFPIEVNSNRSLRSTQPQYNYRSDCLFCGRSVVDIVYKKGKPVPVYTVRFEHFDETLKNICQTRNDDWSRIVLDRINFVGDLHAADTVYHQICSSNFRTGRQVPSLFVEEAHVRVSSIGRPKDDLRQEAFQKAMTFLEENDEEQTTINDLISLMGEYLKGELEPYSFRYMKTKIEEYFGDKVIISEINGKSNVVTYTSTAAVILDKFFQTSRNKDNDIEKIKIIQAAAELIRQDIKCIKTCPQAYPSSQEMESVEKCIEFVPPSLQMLLRNVRNTSASKNTDLKIASLGQAIIQFVRPRVLLAPLQLGLGVQMHHVFASRFLIDSLHNQGFCCSYKEVQTYEKSAALSNSLEIPGYIPGSFMQFIADNADHNTRTIDGNGTFHGMAAMSAVTPSLSNRFSVMRRKTSAEDILRIAKIDIHFYRHQSRLSLVMDQIPRFHAIDPSSNIDLLWKTSWLLRTPRPGWQGMMQMIHKGNHQGKASLIMFPMIDMSSSDLSCIYSTLLFLTTQAKKYAVVVTFDQPLWWKAMTIINNEPDTSDLKSIVLKLGGFHLQMSFLGAIGHLMEGSGIKELFETIFAKNAVGHILNGNAYTRAIRGHFIVDSALNALLFKKIFRISTIQETHSVDSMDVDDDDLNELGVIFEGLLEGAISAADANSSQALIHANGRLQSLKESLQNQRTSKLWLQYMDMVDIMKKFIKAERTGNWMLHLQSVSEMLPYLAAAGRHAYTKSARLYLQMMNKLEEDHPDTHQFFEDGLHVIRRSDRYWAGLSADLVIEQSFMRNLKSRGGLTRGRGMTELQRAIWVSSMPICTDVNRAMQDLTQISYQTSEQHIESSNERQERDRKDTLTSLCFLNNMDPFQDDSSLRNLSTGQVADDSVNVDESKSVGIRILESMSGKNVSDFSFKRKDEAVTLLDKVRMKIDNDVIHVDSQLLFQRFLLAAKAEEDDIASVFIYELCTQPPALFDSYGIPLEANKPALADAIWKIINIGDPISTELPTGYIQNVIDGGALLHRVPWPGKSTYDEIVCSYVSYVTKHYGCAIVVFDGYSDEPCTKDVTHMRRSHGCSGATIHFEGNMTIPLQKAQFLANPKNKQRFIFMLASSLTQSNCTVYHAKNDADLLIVQKAIESSRTYPTFVIGEDTDLLVLLCHHADTNQHDIIFHPEPKQRQKREPRIWDIHKTKEILGPETCKHILFAHAFLGCDTTSRLFNVGKGMVLNKLKESNLFREQADTFCSSDVSQDTIQHAGEKALVSIYGGKHDENIDNLRYRLFREKTASGTSFVKAESLPPTAGAAKYHSLRVYFQVNAWKGVDLDPTQWGWIIKKGKLLPVVTDLAPAPDSLLKVIRCCCKTDCETQRCSCRKQGMNCSSACKECNGISCTNSHSPEPTSDDDMDI